MKELSKHDRKKNKLLITLLVTSIIVTLLDLGIGLFTSWTSEMYPETINANILTWFMLNIVTNGFNLFVQAFAIFILLNKKIKFVKETLNSAGVFALVQGGTLSILYSTNYNTVDIIERHWSASSLPEILTFAIELIGYLNLLLTIIIIVLTRLITTKYKKMNSEQKN